MGWSKVIGNAVYSKASRCTGTLPKKIVLTSRGKVGKRKTTLF